MGTRLQENVHADVSLDLRRDCHRSPAVSGEAAGIFDNVHLLSYYNLAVAFSVFLLIVLPSPIFMLADLTRDLERQLGADRQKRIPTIFNPKYVVHQHQGLFSRIVEALWDNW